MALASGCTVCHQARRTLCQEPSRFSAFLDRKRSVHTYRCWAKQAWIEEHKASPELPVSEAYELGFSDGFTNYVYAGGSGEPPPVPPREFWNVCERSPDGKAAAADWFAGYRHGSRVASAGGYRERGVVLTSLIPCADQFASGDAPLMEPDVFDPSHPPAIDGELLGPALDDSAASPTTEESEAPDMQQPPSIPDGQTPSEPPGELPAPPPPEVDQTTQASASAFKSVLLDAADRHQATPSPSSVSDHSVKPATATTSAAPKSSDSNALPQHRGASLQIIGSAD